jgi:hypothetical protein
MPSARSFRSSMQQSNHAWQHSAEGSFLVQFKNGIGKSVHVWSSFLSRVPTDFLGKANWIQTCLDPKDALEAAGLEE